MRYPTHGQWRPFTRRSLEVGVTHVHVRADATRTVSAMILAQRSIGFFSWYLARKGVA